MELLKSFNVSQTIANTQENYISKLQLIAKGKPSGYFYSVVLPLCILALLAAVDVLLSNQQRLSSDSISIPVLALLYSGYLVQLQVSGKASFFPQLIFFSSCLLLSLVYFNEGRLNGCYFYFFPISMAYFCQTVGVNNKTKWLHYYSIAIIFATALLANYLFFNNGSEPEKISEVWLYRFLTSVFLSGVLVKKLLNLQDESKGAIYLKKNYYEALFQSYQDAFIIYNKETNEVVDCNKRTISMFGLPDDVTVNGLYISQVMFRYLSGQSPNVDLLMNGLPDNCELEADFLTHDKKLFHAHVKSVVFTRDNVDYQILTIRDVTEMKVAERELTSSKLHVEKAARAKARFLSSMSHELRTPLNGIIGTSNLMLGEPQLSEGIKKHINVLKYSSEHMLGIVNDILDFSKIDAGKMELKRQPFNLKDSLDNLLASFESQFKQKNIGLVANYDAQLCSAYIMSDKVKLGQIISNLLSNALKFTLSGKVELNVSIQKAGGKEVSVLFEVKDSGIGIPKDKQAEIFQGFAQVHAEDLKRDFGGTGLGLTISDKLVAMFGGKLEVESELGMGSKFYFTISLPVAETVVKTEETLQPTNEDHDIRGVRVLVVEDNEINANILKSFLNKWEVNVKEATHGIQALELLKYHKFDLVMMDLEMPEMDGYTTIRKIRETNTELPVIAFTAALLENMESSIAENGFNDYILKPYRPSELKKMIGRFAHRKVDY